MAFRRTLTILLNQPKHRAIKAGEIAKLQDIKTAQASVELSRAVERGYAKKVSRGKFIIADRERVIAYLDNSGTPKTQQTQQKGTRGDTYTSPYIRPHKLWFKAQVQNEPEIKNAVPGLKEASFDCWRMWRPSKYSIHYDRLVELDGVGSGRIHYAKGVKANSKRTLEVRYDSVLVSGESFEEHQRTVVKAIQNTLRDLSKEEGFYFALVEFEVKGHFAVKLPLEWGWKLPKGEVKIDDCWWIDSSQDWPELETSIQKRAEELVKLPETVKNMQNTLDKLPETVKNIVFEAIKEAFEQYNKSKSADDTRNYIS